MKETDLFAPVKSYFESKNYIVKGEILDADIIAEKASTLIAIELKLKPSLKLLLQATNNTKTCDFSYIALPVENKRSEKRLIQQFGSLLILSGIGLLAVNIENNKCKELIKAREQAVLDTRTRRKIEAEFRARLNTFTKGGTHGGSAITAYKEAALKVALFLDKIEKGEIQVEVSQKKRIPSTLIKLGCNPKTPTILRNNYYKWFERTSPGSYRLTEEGKQALVEYEKIVRLIVSTESSEYFF